MKRKNNRLKFYLFFIFLFSFLSFTKANAISILGSGVPESFSKLVEKVSPSVVNINTTRLAHITPEEFMGVDPFFDQFLKEFFQRRGSTRVQPKQHSLGTGFIISEDGKILTNYHVIAGADEIFVTLNDETKVKAKLISHDKKIDIAVLQLTKPGPYPTATLGDSEQAKIGDWVIAVGNPFGLGQTVTTGIISAKGRVLGAGPYDDFIQTDASINPGNSGGPLFNTDGEVIGINTAIIAGGAQGLGFATPINVTKNVVVQLIKSGQVERGWLGVSIKDMDENEARQLGLSKPEGVLVLETAMNGPAQNAGLRPGDVIIKLEENKVKDSHTLPRMIADHKPGTEVSLTYIRRGKKQETKAILGDLDNPHKAFVYSITKTPQIDSKPQIGFDLRNLEISDKTATKKGAYITRVHPSSLAEAVGIQRGDIIVAVNNKAVQSVADFQNQFKQIQKNDRIALSILREKTMMYFAFKKE